MLYLSGVKLALGPRITGASAAGRALRLPCLSRPQPALCGQPACTHGFRGFSTSDSAEEKAVTPARAVSRFGSAQDSGTVNVVRVPNMGKNTKKCKIYKWLKKPGDYVNVDDLLCVLETDLIFGKVHSLVAGTVVENVCQEGRRDLASGSTVAVGSDLAVLVDDRLAAARAHEARPGGFGGDGRRWFSTRRYAPMLSFGARLERCAAPAAQPFSTQKYVPMISFGKHRPAGAPPAAAAKPAPGAAAAPGARAKRVQVLDDFYKSPFRTWMRTISEEEINTVNHGTVDVK